MTTCSSKIVVFDLDETLGYFMELGMFWDALKAYIKHKQIKKDLDQKLFNGVLDLYPEFLRPNIIGILNYLKKKKSRNHCDKLMIYTNNQGPVEWATHIMNYFEKKIDFKIFDQIIAAFKVQGKKVELCRTTHMKTHADLIKCTKLPVNTQICFLDDVFYPDMSNEKIYYINVKPYIYDLEFNEMITRMLNSGILGAEIDNPTYCREFILTFMKKYNYIYVEKTNEVQNVDKIVSKKILQHLHTFFKIKPIESPTNKTNKITKRRKIIHNKTLKKSINNVS
jgi:hypothetical protein